MKTKTAKAEKKVLNALRKRKTIRHGKLVAKYPDLPIAYAIWTLKQNGKIKRVERGEYRAA